MEIGSSTAAFPFSVLWREYAQVVRWQCAGYNAEMEVASRGQTMSVLRRGRSRCVGRFPVLLVPWRFFRLADAVWCTGHRSALHRQLQRAALGFAACCVRHTSPHAIVTGALPMGNLPLSCILSIRSFCSFLPYLPFPHPLPTSSSAAHPFHSNHAKESSPILCSCGRIGLDSVCGCDVCDRAGRRQSCYFCLCPRSRFIS